METQNTEETEWFEGVKWSDVNGDGGNNSDQSLTFHSSDETTKTSPRKTVFSDNSDRVETEKNAATGSELQLGLLLSFPPDIILDILSRLPVSDLMRGRIVCKSWNKLTKEPYFIDLQVSRTLHQPHSLLLKQSMLGSGNKLHMVDTASDQWRSKELPLKSLDGGNVNISNSCNGLFCISRIDGEKPVIYNPITKDCLPLPKSEFEPRKTFAASLSSYALGFDAYSKKYKVVRVYNIYHDIETRRFHTKAEIITLGESSWRKLDFLYKVTHEDTIKSVKSVFLNGSFHWAIHREANVSPLPHILVLDITTEMFQTIIFPPSIEIPKDVALIDLGESLALVKHSDFSNDLLQAWKIVGCRDNGGRFCYLRIDTSVIHVPFIRGLTLLSVLSNGDFLCKALQTSEVGPSFSAFCNHLVRYNPQKNEGYSLNVPGIPRLFYAIPFIPSLASPNIP